MYGLNRQGTLKVEKLYRGSATSPRLLNTPSRGPSIQTMSVPQLASPRSTGRKMMSARKTTNSFNKRANSISDQVFGDLVKQ